MVKSARSQVIWYKSAGKPETKNSGNAVEFGTAGIRDYGFQAAWLWP